MVVSTRRLFLRLLRTLDIETVCDIGSMDGTDSLRFRRALPRAEILAFEPNPGNYDLMSSSEAVRNSSIRCFAVAVSDRDSEAPFFVVDAEYAPGRDPFRRGMSSLYKRSNESLIAEVIQVATVRLDRLLEGESLDGSRIALWIDTEGAAFEVIEGAAAVLPATLLVHVEVETAPIIGAEQKLFADVEMQLDQAGFVLLATDQPRAEPQFNALFVRREILNENANQISLWARVMQLRRIATRTVWRLAPRRMRGMLARLAH